MHIRRAWHTAKILACHGRAWNIVYFVKVLFDVSIIRFFFCWVFGWQCTNLLCPTFPFFSVHSSSNRNNFWCLYLPRKYDIQHVSSEFADCDFHATGKKCGAQKKSIESVEHKFWAKKPILLLINSKSTWLLLSLSIFCACTRQHSICIAFQAMCYYGTVLLHSFFPVRAHAIIRANRLHITGNEKWKAMREKWTSHEKQKYFQQQYGFVNTCTCTTQSQWLWQFGVFVCVGVH